VGSGNARRRRERRARPVVGVVGGGGALGRSKNVAALAGSWVTTRVSITAAVLLV